MGKKWWIMASLTLGVVTVILLMSIYKTTDIGFVGEKLVENVAKVVGVETPNMKRKREFETEAKVQQKREFTLEDLGTIIISDADSIQAIYNNIDSISQVSKLKTPKAEIITNKEKITDVILAVKKNELENKPEEIKSEKPPVGIIINKSFKSKNSEKDVAANLSTLGAYPVQSIEVNNNDFVQFRTAHEIDINGNLVPKNTVFEAKVSFIAGKLIFTALELRGMSVQLINNTHQIAEFASTSNQRILLSQTKEIDFVL